MEDLNHWTIRLPARRGTWRSSIFEPQKKRRLICSDRQFISSAMGRLSTGFLGRHRLSKVKATLAQGPMRKFQLPLSVGGPNLRQRVSVEKECNLRVDDVIPFLHTLHGWINVQWDLPFWMWKSTFISVLTSASVSVIRSSLQRKQRGWIGKHTNRRNVHEVNCHLGFTTANFPLFRIPKNFSEDFLVCVFRSRKCGFNMSVWFPTIIAVRIFWNFRVEFNSKLVCFWWEGTWQGNMRVSSTFLFPDIDVKLVRSEWWSWVRYWKWLYWQVIWNIRGNAWSSMWCELRCKSQLIDVICWITCSGHCVGASMFRRCLTEVQWIGWDVVFFDHFVDASQFFVSPKSRWWVVFWNSILFIKIRNNHMLCQRIVFGEQEYSCTLWRWRAYDLDLGLDMTLRTANSQRWEFQFLRLAKTTLSRPKMSDAQNMEVHKRWTTSVS